MRSLMIALSLSVAALPVMASDYLDINQQIPAASSASTAAMDGGTTMPPSNFNDVP